MPTKTDIQQLIAAVELSCKQVIEGIKEETTALGHRVEAVETSQDEILHTIAALQETATHHENVLNSLLVQMDDYENWKRRQNIHIRAPDLLHTVQGLFLQLLDDAAPADI